MKVALTGTSGHLGATVLETLCKRNFSVKALIRGNDSRSCNSLPVEIVKGDLHDNISLRSLMQDCDTVIHSAAMISVNADRSGLVQLTNVEGTRSVVEQALSAGVKRIIYISTIHTFQQAPFMDTLDENRELIEKGFAYDLTKLAGQRIALEATKKGMEVIVIHPTSILGPYDYKPSLMGKVLIDLYTGKLPFIINGGFDYCDCRDIANAIVNSISMGRPGEAYLLSGKWHSLKQLTTILSNVSAKKISVLEVPAFAAIAGLPFVRAWGMITKKEPLYTREALNALLYSNRFISSEKAKTALNYTTRPLEETLADTFRWFRNNNYL